MKILCLLLGLCSLTVLAQNKSELSFLKQTIDLGTIVAKETSKVDVDFVFSNKGNVPLVIHKVKASCGCTVPRWTKVPVRPGKDGVITVSFEHKGKKGTFLKTLFVESNAKNDLVLLKLKGVVK
ncbi:DUF1573 domain-containing protein [Bacteroides ovatus]|uniref:DUF1573 domain-containing protein n=1 Tax=Bacteroides ovatus TaxID=28116 RepID=UPI001F3FFEFE|nr:DUF1573 domain-containing protein [Bacteroides ovatus]MCE8922732.1 DUF1573 domain-containing protein [Bacteroides ovatus]